MTRDVYARLATGGMASGFPTTENSGVIAIANPGAGQCYKVVNIDTVHDMLSLLDTFFEGDIHRSNPRWTGELS